MKNREILHILLPQYEAQLAIKTHIRRCLENLSMNSLSSGKGERYLETVRNALSKAKWEEERALSDLMDIQGRLVSLDLTGSPENGSMEKGGT